jgi:hypothetical protein
MAVAGWWQGLEDTPSIKYVFKVKLFACLKLWHRSWQVVALLCVSVAASHVFRLCLWTLCHVTRGDCPGWPHHALLRTVRWTAQRSKYSRRQSAVAGYGRAPRQAVSHHCCTSSIPSHVHELVVCFLVCRHIYDRRWTAVQAVRG